MLWILLNNATMDVLGLLPGMIGDDDPRPAREQFDSEYQHGGGWCPLPGFTLDTSKKLPTLRYPGDPPLKAFAIARLRDERIVLFECSIVCIIQKDGAFEAARMD
jgi:hypothetical protein